MATYNISVPANIQAVGLADIASNLNWTISILRNRYSSIVSECSKNSNVPEELIYSMILALSNGENNTVFRTNDYTTAPYIRKPQARMGLFSLSNQTARTALVYELKRNRLNDAERAYLNKYGNEWVKLFIQKERPSATETSVNKWWQIASQGVNVRAISDEVCVKSFPFNLNTPEVSIAIGTLLIGQAWDYYGKINNDPLGSVVTSILLPWDYNYIVSEGSFAFNTTVLQEIMNKFKIYKFNNTAALEKLPRPAPEIKGGEKVGFGIVINPKANNPRIGINGYVVDYLSSVIGRGGILENLVNKRA